MLNLGGYQILLGGTRCRGDVDVMACSARIHAGIRRRSPCLQSNHALLMQARGEGFAVSCRMHLHGPGGDGCTADLRKP
jgi:hypothetical protein